MNNDTTLSDAARLVHPGPSRPTPVGQSQFRLEKASRIFGAGIGGITIYFLCSILPTYTITGVYVLLFSRGLN